MTSQPSAKKLQAKKKSFRLDKDVHTQLVLDDLDSDIQGKKSRDTAIIVLYVRFFIVNFVG